MKKSVCKKALGLLFLLIVSGIYCAAQPPGGGPPHGMRPPGGNPEWNQNQNMPTVRQKKKVREGDTFVVVGYLRDSITGEPLPYVNVAVLDSVNNEFVKGTATNIDGRFELKDIPQGPMVLRISAIGYGNRAIPFRVSNNTDLGIIKMVESSTSLNEVTITAEKPIYAMEGEKLVYNVSEDPSIQTGTTEDALQNAPGVEVDVEGNITLRGVTSVEIWVNDKPSKLTEENLKTYLQTLPANAVARIETITNPSAKYATSAEAVINIVTSAHIKSNQFVSFGVNGSNQPFVSPWISYMWKKEKWSINAFASGRYSDRRNVSDSWALQRVDGENEGEYINTWSDTTSQTSANRRYTANVFLGINYEIDSTSEISFDGGGFYNRGFSDMNRSKRQIYYYNPEDAAPYSTLFADTTLSNTDDQSIFGHVGVDYTKKFDNNGHNLRIGLNGNLSNNANEQWYNRYYEDYSFSYLDEHRYLLSKSQSYGFSLDARYNRPYNENGELSYGLRADHHQSSATYDRYNDTLLQVIDSLRTYQFKDAETELSADVNWTHRWGGFTLSTGLGVESERTSFDYDTYMPFEDDSTYWHVHLRPSIHLTYRTDNMHNWKINYTMRISAPNYSQITRFRSYGEDSYTVGNPNGLRHSFTHNVEAGWQKYFESFGNIGLEAYGRWSTNEISSLTDSEFDEFLDRVVSYSKPYNMGNSWRYGTSLNLTYRPSGFFNVRLYANLYNYGYHMEYDRDGVHQVDERDKWSWSVRVNAWAKIFDQLQLTASAFYNSPTLSLMSERKARYSLNMGLRSDFFKRKLSVFINVQDIFNWGAKVGSGSANTNPYYLSESTNKMLNSRYISAGLTFRFGKLELEKQAKEGGDETGDTL
ncbi:MAG: TonB-dependent receptor family protein [Bacteroidales bacterium]|nr:TonB-dependent receptor family protein [Bacteroidales bacterium]